MPKDIHAVNDAPPEQIPPDPPGWEVRLTDDCRWLAVRMSDGHALDPTETKAEAVEAALADSRGA